MCMHVHVHTASTVVICVSVSNPLCSSRVLRMGRGCFVCSSPTCLYSRRAFFCVCVKMTAVCIDCSLLFSRSQTRVPLRCAGFLGSSYASHLVQRFPSVRIVGFDQFGQGADAMRVLCRCGCGCCVMCGHAFH